MDSIWLNSEPRLKSEQCKSPLDSGINLTPKTLSLGIFQNIIKIFYINRPRRIRPDDKRAMIAEIQAQIDVKHRHFQ